MIYGDPVRPNNPEQFLDSLKKGDLALYEVKRNGRCGYHFYEDLQETLKDTLEDALEEKTLADDRPAGT